MARRDARVPRHRPDEDLRYQLALSEESVEKLSRGECPEIVALDCWEMLRWKRDGARMNARELNGEH